MFEVLFIINQRVKDMTRGRKILIGAAALLLLWIADDIFYSSKSEEEKEDKAKAKVTYLAKPVEGKDYEWGTSDMEFSGGLKWRHAFALDHEGYAKFVLDDEYEYIHFFVGNYQYSGFPGEDAIATVWADDKKIYDGIVRYDGVPEQVIAKISGAKELTFRIAQGIGPVGFGDVSLWKKGEEPRQTCNLIKEKPQTLELVKDLRPYYTYRIDEIGTGKHEQFKINSVVYKYGLVANIQQALIGDNPTKAHFYLRRQFSKLSFIVGMVDNTSHGSGWFTVKADGKTIYECELVHNETARQVTLDISGCDQLTFATRHLTGDNVWGGITNIMVYPEGEDEGVEAGLEGAAPPDPRLKELPDVTKLLSNIKPFSIGSDIDKQVYRGESDHITFTMGGTRFSEGFILYEAANFMDDNLTSYVVFDLGNEFDYVRFTAGYVAKSWTMYNDVLRVFADDEMILETPLIATSPNQEFILPINKCRRLRFENKGQGTMDIAAFGVADLVVYRGHDTSENPFVHPVPDCPPEIDLLDLGKPYIHYVSIRQGKENLYDGSTKSKYFQLGDERIYKGFLLKTSTHFSFDFGPLAGKGGAAGVAGAVAAGVSFVPLGAVGGAMIGSTLAGAAALLALAAGGTAVENSLAAFNTYGEYNSLTFTVACMEPAFGELYTGYPESLLIGVNGNVVQELALYDNMTPQTVTIPIEGCEQLMFWLSNTSGGWSGQFVFYDLKLSKKKLPLKVPSELGGVKPVILAPEWSAPYDNNENFVGRVAVSGNRDVDDFIKRSGDLSYKLKYALQNAWIDYKVTTTFLKSRSGEIYKSVRLIQHKRGEGFRYFDPPVMIEEVAYPEAVKSLSEIQNIFDTEYAEAKSYMDAANSGYAAFTGAGAEKYKEYMDKSNALMEQCGTLLPMMIEQKKAEIMYLKKVMETRLSELDGKTSTAYTSYCTLWDTDEVPKGSYVTPVDEYRPKE